MKKILNVLREMDFTIYQSERFNLDRIHFDPYQDEGEEFERSKIFEKENKPGKFVTITQRVKTSNFSYFLDGSRLTYKIGDIETTDKKFMPVVAGQIATGVCKRIEGKIKKQTLEKANLILLHSSINEDDLNEFKDKLQMTSFRDINSRVSFLDYEKLSLWHSKSFEFFKFDNMMNM
jgi:hypothetical protein